MEKSLLKQAITKYLLGVVTVGVLLFLPAGTLNYWQGWLLMATLFVPILLVGVFLMAKNPQLLQKRLDAKENTSQQQMVVKLSGLLFVVAFVVAGLNHRYQWMVLPDWAVWVAA